MSNTETANKGNIQFGLFLFGTIFLCVGLYATGKQVLTYAWESTQGQVTLNSWEEGRTNGSAGIPNIRAEITYTYTVHGQQFTSHRIRNDTFYLSQEKKFRQYPTGARVTVYYNPSNPAQSILEKGIGVGFIEICIGCFLFWAGRRIGNT